MNEPAERGFRSFLMIFSTGTPQQFSFTGDGRLGHLFLLDIEVGVATLVADMTDVNAQLRISPWPAGGLPLPERYYTVPCVVRPARQTIGLGRVLKWRPSPNTYRRVQPGEIYLKLIHTDLDDDASVEDFIGRYGMMGLHELKGRYAGRSPAHELAGDARPEPDDPLQARRWRARNALTLDRDAYKDGEESFDEFLGAAYLLRDAHTLWRCFNEGLDPYDQLLDLVGAEEFGFGEIPDHLVWRWTLDVLNMIFEGALAPFSPRLTSISGLVDRGGTSTGGRRRGSLSRSTRSYSSNCSTTSPPAPTTASARTTDAANRSSDKKAAQRKVPADQLAPSTAQRRAPARWPFGLTVSGSGELRRRVGRS